MTTKVKGSEAIVVEETATEWMCICPIPDCEPIRLSKEHFPTFAMAKRVLRKNYDGFEFITEREALLLNQVIETPPSDEYVPTEEELAIAKKTIEKIQTAGEERAAVMVTEEYFDEETSEVFDLAVEASVTFKTEEQEKPLVSPITIPESEPVKSQETSNPLNEEKMETNQTAQQEQPKFTKAQIGASKTVSGATDIYVGGVTLVQDVVNLGCEVAKGLGYIVEIGINKHVLKTTDAPYQDMALYIRERSERNADKFWRDPAKKAALKVYSFGLESQAKMSNMVSAKKHEPAMQ